MSKANDILETIYKAHGDKVGPYPQQVIKNAEELVENLQDCEVTDMDTLRQLIDRGEHLFLTDYSHEMENFVFSHYKHELEMPCIVQDYEIGNTGVSVFHSENTYRVWSVSADAEPTHKTDDPEWSCPNDLNPNLN